MANKKRLKKFNISNKLAYTLVAIFSIVLIGVGVFALGPVPNPGHSISQLQTCDDGQILKMSGSAWSCVTPQGWNPTDIKLTTASHNGNFGGYKLMYDWIQTNGCSGYHVCDAAEITRAIQSGLVPTTPSGSLYTGGWYNTGLIYTKGSNIMYDCRAWTYSTNDGTSYGPRWYDTQYATPSQFPDSWGCWGSLPVYCCK